MDPDRSTELEEARQAFALQGTTKEMLQVISSASPLMVDSLALLAVQMGNTHAFKLCVREGCPVDENCVVQAAAMGHLSILQELLALPELQQLTRGHLAVAHASAHGRNEVIQTFVIDGPLARYVNEESTFQAARFGHLQTLKLLCERFHIGIEARGIIEACEKGHVHIVHYSLCSAGNTLTAEDIRRCAVAAAGSGQLAIMEILSMHSRFRPHEEIAMAAARSDNVICIQYLEQIGCLPITPRVFLSAPAKGIVRDYLFAVTPEINRGNWSLAVTPSHSRACLLVHATAAAVLVCGAIIAIRRRS